MSPQKLKRIIELAAELEELMEASTTFLHGNGGDDILGILIADRETTEAIMGDTTARSDAN